MIKQAKILAARRAYEFHSDDLRLAVLSGAEVREKVEQRFGFQIAQVARPIEIFGPVGDDIPSGSVFDSPGVVFDLGAVSSPEGWTVPIRFLHFEPRRIVVDVAGPSSAIDLVFDELRRIADTVKIPDEVPVIGAPERELDYSEVTARFGFDLDRLFCEPFLALARRTFSGSEEGATIAPVGVKFQKAEPSGEIGPSQIGAFRFSKGQLLELRMGTHPRDRAYYSAAELPTDKHLAWLESLDEELS